MVAPGLPWQAPVPQFCLNTSLTASHTGSLLVDELPPSPVFEPPPLALLPSEPSLFEPPALELASGSPAFPLESTPAGGRPASLVPTLAPAPAGLPPVGYSHAA